MNARSFLTLALCGLGLSAQAQVTMGSIPMWTTNFMLNQQIVQMADKAHFEKIGARPPTSSDTTRLEPSPRAANTTFAPARQPGEVARQMAASYPRSHQQEAEKSFRELLSGYGRIEQQFGLPRNDLAGAVAAFLAGGTMAMNGTGFPDAHFKPLVEQMRQVIGSQAEFRRATAAEKQDMYEQMAILGMFMATTQMALQQRPDPELAVKVRQSARGYLEQFLGTDASRVQITAAGLALK